jgi:hypothetical protein
MKQNTVDPEYRPPEGFLEALCPIREQAQFSLALSRDLLRAVRKLKARLKHCESCPCGGECAVLGNFREQFAAALGETIREIEG